MTKLPGIFAPVIVRRAPHWSDKGVVIANGPFYGPYDGTGPQLRARAALSRAAQAAFGQTGFVNGIPIVAARVAEQTAGQSHGGQDPNSRRQAAHAMAGRRLAVLERMAGGRGGATTSGGVGGASFF
jgi:hypothetical protein